MRLIFTATWFLVKLILASLEALFWMAHGVTELITAASDAHKARRSLTDGTLHCPAGHEVPTLGETYECRACGYCYSGSIWRCANPECEAVTPYCHCPTCGLSVRNPYRWGRP